MAHSKCSNILSIGAILKNFLGVIHYQYFHQSCFDQGHVFLEYWSRLNRMKHMSPGIATLVSWLLGTKWSAVLPDNVGGGWGGFRECGFLQRKDTFILVHIYLRHRTPTDMEDLVDLHSSSSASLCVYRLFLIRTKDYPSNVRSSYYRLIKFFFFFNRRRDGTGLKQFPERFWKDFRRKYRRSGWRENRIIMNGLCWWMCKILIHLPYPFLLANVVTAWGEFRSIKHQMPGRPVSASTHKTFTDTFFPGQSPVGYHITKMHEALAPGVAGTSRVSDNFPHEWQRASGWTLGWNQVRISEQEPLNSAKPRAYIDIFSWVWEHSIKGTDWWSFPKRDKRYQENPSSLEAGVHFCDNSRLGGRQGTQCFLVCWSDNPTKAIQSLCQSLDWVSCWASDVESPGSAQSSLLSSTIGTCIYSYINLWLWLPCAQSDSLKNLIMINLIGMAPLSSGVGRHLL